MVFVQSQIPTPFSLFNTCIIIPEEKLRSLCCNYKKNCFIIALCNIHPTLPVSGWGDIGRALGDVFSLAVAHRVERGAL